MAATAFVLSGGASLGSIQVGMLQGLAEAGVSPDLLIGTSVGAFNAGWIASSASVDSVAALAEVWRGLGRADVFPIMPLRGFLGFVGKRQSLLEADGLRRLLRNHLRFRRLEDAATPLHVVATDVLTGAGVRLSKGDAVDAITASSAIPGVFPPVEIDGRLLMDGGVVNNAAISHAVELGATTIWVLPAGYACALPQPPRTALAIGLQALGLLVQQRLAFDIAQYHGHIDLRVVPPLCPVGTSPADFSRADQLITASYQSTNAWFADGGPDLAPATSLGLHPHDHP